MSASRFQDNNSGLGLKTQGILFGVIFLNHIPQIKAENFMIALGLCRPICFFNQYETYTINIRLTRYICVWV